MAAALTACPRGPPYGYRDRDDIPQVTTLYAPCSTTSWAVDDDSLGSMLPADQTQMRESQPPIPTSGFPSRQSVLDKPAKMLVVCTIPRVLCMRVTSTSTAEA